MLDQNSTVLLLDKVAKVKIEFHVLILVYLTVNLLGLNDCSSFSLTLDQASLDL
jgi:hypothetical protein